MNNSRERVSGNITPSRETPDNDVPSASASPATFAQAEHSSTQTRLPVAFSVLMVCLGNICRSPLAEGILQTKANQAGLRWTVDSAGTNGYHVGEAPHHLSQKVAREHGLDISHQRSRKFTAADFQQFDKIYAMAEDVLDDIKRIAGRFFDPQKVSLLLNEVHPGQHEDVPDPYYGAYNGYQEVYHLIDTAADRIIEKYGTLKGTNTK